MLQHRWTRPCAVALALTAVVLGWTPLAASADLEAADRKSWAAQTPEIAAGAVPPNQRVRLRWSGAISEPDALRGEPRGERASERLRHRRCGGQVKQTKGSTAAPADGRSQVQVVLLPSDSKVEGRESVLGVAEPKASAAWVYFSSVSRSLGLDPARRVNWTLSERRDLARALGRVAAHEIAHVLAPTLPHAEHGLMAPHLKRSFLCDSKVVWDPASAGRSRKAAHRPQRRSPPRTSPQPKGRLVPARTRRFRRPARPDLGPFVPGRCICWPVGCTLAVHARRAGTAWTV